MIYLPPWQDIPETLCVNCLDDVDWTGGIVSTPWCYLDRIDQVDSIPDDLPVHRFLEYVVDGEGNNLFQFSVTSKEPRYKEFLEALEMVPGAVVIPFVRGNYTAYLCTFPSHPEFPEN
jgi:hypothetical protein